MRLIAYPDHKTTLKVKFQRLLAVTWHCRARIDCKIGKHYSTRFWRYTAYYRRTIVSRYILLYHDCSDLSHVLVFTITWQEMKPGDIMV